MSISFASLTLAVRKAEPVWSKTNQPRVRRFIQTANPLTTIPVHNTRYGRLRKARSHAAYHLSYLGLNCASQLAESAAFILST